jgi:hypothetical protein
MSMSADPLVAVASIVSASASTASSIVYQRFDALNAGVNVSDPIVSVDRVATKGLA